MQKARTHYCSRCLTTFREISDICPNLSCRKAPPGEGWGVVLDKGDHIDRHYEIGRVLAVGGAGLTYLARELDENGVAQPPELAVKVLYSARAQGSWLSRLATEAQILQEIDHENIVQCRGFVHRAGQEPYLVTLFEHGGSLTHHIERVGAVSPRVAAGILRQILLALDTTHQRGVVHRDLKPDNVLIHLQVAVDVIPHVRLTDFGIAKVAGGLASKVTKQGSFVGTPEYAAPEQFEQMAPSAATDIFACGGLLYYTLTGKPPVILSRRSDIESSFKEICEQLPPVLIPEQHGQRNQHQRSQLQEIINNTMTRRPEHRWTAQAVIRKLNQLLEGDLPQLKSGNLELTDPVAPQRMNMPSASPTFALSAPPVSDSNSGLGASDSLEAPEDTPVIEFLAAAAVAAAGAAVVAAAVVAAASESSETESEPASPPPPSEPSVETPPPLQAVAAPPEKPSFQRDAEETWAPQVAAQLPDESSAVPVVAGVLGVGAVAFLLAGAVAVLVAACGLWFYTTGPGAIVKPEVAAVWEADADWLSGASRQTAQSVVQDALSGALSGCSHQGALVATVWSVDGKIAHVELDKHWVSAANTGCLVDGLQGIATGVTEGVRIRVAVSLDP